MKRVSILAAAGFALLLGSCSSDFDFHAEMIGGRLAFVPTGNWFSRPDRFCMVDVRASSGPRAKAEAGDDPQQIAEGAYWSYWPDGCNNRFPFVYGQALKGKSVLDTRSGLERPHVRAKRLSPNVVYEIRVLAPRSAYGSARFALDGQGHVRNFGP
ncbi:MAG: hypothetical protein K0R64_1831 [Novosphingobium lindaniclasticum]|jgi:hypothetical protein|uniref:hypothetical protein n=1 Tax=Novosphingobium lindaniclasticum TaxID=1329895 RepID=UPI00240A944A|nr:hypothetical protein [Novosphingobium lindaniclasticum]MDF2638847.1 hypothetical protein [Novosphingobium lindaniclasticum]